MKLLEPIQVKNVTLPNRIMFPPLTTGYEEKDGSIGSRSLNFYTRLAEGGVGYIVLGDVSPIATFSPTPRLYEDSQIESYRKLAEALHAHGAKLALQLFHPEYDVESLFEYFKRGDMEAARKKLHHDMQFYVQEVTADKLQAILEKYKECAARAARAGVDAIEIHGDRLVGALCSPVLNHRTDEYGGSFENRIRFALETAAAIRSAAPGLLIDYKLPVITPLDDSGALRGKGGMPVPEAVSLAKRLEEAGVDMLHVAQANHTGNMGDTIPAMGTQPYGFFEKYAAMVKGAVTIPVSTAGRILTPEYAEAMLEAGSCDIVGLGRPLLADPDWAVKLKRGEGRSIRQCIMCNKGCTDAIQNRQFISCILNAENGHEYEKRIEPARQEKRVVVIGGGPAGLEAARVAAARGHRVDLYERDCHLGGQLTIAGVPPRKHELLRFLRYLEGELCRAGVALHLGKEPSEEEILSLAPDHVLIACGAENLCLGVPGADGVRVLDAWKVLDGRQLCAGRVTVIGGGLVGVETAELLARRGARVTIVEMLDRIAGEESNTILPYLLGEFEKYGVCVLTEHTLERIMPAAVFCRDKDGNTVEIASDFAVMAAGARARDYDTKYLSEAGIPFTKIGDCEGKPSDIGHAVTAGYDAANAI